MGDQSFYHISLLKWGSTCFDSKINSYKNVLIWAVDCVTSIKCWYVRFSIGQVVGQCYFWRWLAEKMGRGGGQYLFAIYFRKYHIETAVLMAGYWWFSISMEHVYAFVVCLRLAGLCYKKQKGGIPQSRLCKLVWLDLSFQNGSAYGTLLGSKYMELKLESNITK